MCLIAVIPALAEREAITSAWIKDIYARNSDGFGFMWMKQGQLYTWKDTGNARKFLKAFRQVEAEAEGEWAVHTRMATHGEVNPEMAHPYPVDAEVVGEASIVMMHNGILAHGNTADRKKSDTWHYVNDYLRPLLAKFGTELLDTPAFAKLIGSDIGNNRFVLMATDGKIRIINRHQGLVWNGMWLSNTYAWDAEKFGAVKPRVKYTPVATTGSAGNGYMSGWTPTTTRVPLPSDTRRSCGDFWSQWGDLDAQEEEKSVPLTSLSLVTDTEPDEEFGTLLVLDVDGNVTKASAKEEAYDFLFMLAECDYSALASSLTVNDVAEWIVMVGRAEYIDICNDIAVYNTLDPNELFASRVSGRALRALNAA